LTPEVLVVTTAVAILAAQGVTTAVAIPEVLVVTAVEDVMSDVA
jgi:hypothetical protein